MARSMPVCRRRQCRRLTNATSFFRPCRPPAVTAHGLSPSSASRRFCSSCAALFAAVPLAPVPAFVASYQSALAINDLHHRHPAVFAVRHRALAGVAAARERISVHRGRRDRPRPDLSRPVCADRVSQCRPADHGLALHDLARRFSAARARLCAAERQGWRHENTGIDRRAQSWAASSRSASRCRSRPGSSPPDTTFCRS